MTCPEPETLSAHLDGETDASEAETLEDHLEGCPDCADHLERLRVVRGLVRATAPDDAEEAELSPAFFAELDDRLIAEAETPAERRRRTRSGELPWGTILRYAAAVLLAFLAGMLTYRQIGPEPARTADDADAPTPREGAPAGRDEGTTTGGGGSPAEDALPPSERGDATTEAGPTRESTGVLHPAGELLLLADRSDHSRLVRSIDELPEDEVHLLMPDIGIPSSRLEARSTGRLLARLARRWPELVFEWLRTRRTGPHDGTTRAVALRMIVHGTPPLAPDAATTVAEATVDEVPGAPLLEVLREHVAGGENPSVTRALVDAAGRTRLPAIRSLLEDLARTGDGSVRCRAVRSLGMHGPTAVPLLADLLDAPAPVAAEAALALGRTRSLEAVPPLVHALGSCEDPDLRWDIVRSLRFLTGRREGTASEWAAWLAGSEDRPESVVGGPVRALPDEPACSTIPLGSSGVTFLVDVGSDHPERHRRILETTARAIESLPDDAPFAVHAFGSTVEPIRSTRFLGLDGVIRADDLTRDLAAEEVRSLETRDGPSRPGEALAAVLADDPRRHVVLLRDADALTLPDLDPGTNLRLRTLARSVPVRVHQVVAADPSPDRSSGGREGSIGSQLDDIVHLTGGLATRLAD